MQSTKPQVSGAFDRHMPGLEHISPLNISRIAFLRDNFPSAGDFGLFVYDLIFDVDIFTDHASAEHDAVADDGALFDDTAATDDGIFNRAVYHAAVGYDGIFDACRIEIMGRAGIIRPSVDWPFLMEEVLCGFIIDQRHIGLIIALEICDRCKIATVCNAPYIELATFFVDDIGECEHRRHFLCLVDKLDEQLCLHDISIHENIAVLYISMVRLDRKYALLFVQVQDVAA